MNDANLVLCQKETGALLNLNSQTCEENSRTAPDARAEEIIDAIVASCRIVATPTPQARPQLCPGGEVVSGAQTITIEDSIRVTLPDGEFAIQVDVPLAVAQVCNLNEGYTLALRFSDCGRPDIQPPNAPAQDVLDNIVSSCTLLHPVTPVPTPSATIQPPSTGDAGLFPVP